MADELKNLTSDENLVLYLSGEMPAGQSAQVQLLAESDPQLKVRLNELIDVKVRMETELRAADAVERASTSAATARTIRSMRGWHADRPTRAAAAQRSRRLTWPSWGIPAAIAATILIGFVAWWGNQQAPEGPVELASKFPSPASDEASATDNAEPLDLLAALHVNTLDGSDLAGVEDGLDALSYFADQMR